jgi:hypothetical protein
MRDAAGDGSLGAEDDEHTNEQERATRMNLLNTMVDGASVNDTGF